MNIENRWLLNLACNQISLVVVARLNFEKQRDTPTTINEYRGFHQNVGKGNKSLNAMAPDPILCEAFDKGSVCARLSLI